MVNDIFNKRNWKSLFILLIGVVVSVVLILPEMGSLKGKTSNEYQKEVDRLDFDFRVYLIDDDTLSFQRMKSISSDRNRLITIISPSCSYCEKQLDLIRGFKDKFGKNNIDIVLISTGQQDVTIKYLEEKGLGDITDLYYASEEDIVLEIQDFVFPYSFYIDGENKMKIIKGGVLGFYEINNLFVQ